MKQLIAYLSVGSAGLLMAGAMVLGEPAHADIAVVQAAAQSLPDLTAWQD